MTESDPQSPPPRTQIRWSIPVLAPGCGLAAGVASAWTAGDSLGLYFAGVGFLTLLLPALFLAAQSPLERWITSAALVAGVGVVWVIAGRSASFAQTAGSLLVLAAFATAICGAAAILRRLPLGDLPAASLVVVLGALWLTWPIWLAPWLRGAAGQTLAGFLVPVHPLMAFNGILRHLGIWTEHGAIMYQLTTLGQHIPYALPNPAWSILAHGLVGAALLIVSRRAC